MKIAPNLLFRDVIYIHTGHLSQSIVSTIQETKNYLKYYSLKITCVNLPQTS